MDSRIFASADYDPYLEWPVSEIDSEYNAPIGNQTSDSHHQTCFRLVAKSSAVLARKRRVAVLDTYDEAQIGRDVSTSEDVPRIRLKDMEVSKLHATLFWDQERNEWAIVDMGSKHGTFVRSESRKSLPAPTGQLDMQTTADNSLGLDTNTITLDPMFTRLSPPRQASVPRTLHNSDELSIGRTTFVVHVHPAGIPCDECRSNGEFDIPLFSVTGSTQTQKQSAEVAGDTPRASRDAKSAINLLKRTLLSRHSDASKTHDGASQLYIDRSAKRRALHPYSRSSSPAPGVPSRSTTNLTPSMENEPWNNTYRASPASSSVTSLAYDLSVSSSISAPPAPISDANIGHRLLAKQGWVPGSTLGVPAPRSSNASDEEGWSLGDERAALSEPLQIVANVGRKGLGMHAGTTLPLSMESATKSTVEDWRGESRRRRWEELLRSVKPK